MANIDWHYLRRPIIVLMASILIAAGLVAAGYEFESRMDQQYQQSLGTLQSTHRLYSNMVNDIDLLEQYKTLYEGYRDSGLVGEERRLSWIESLETANSGIRLPQLSYSLLPQEDFKRPGLKVAAQVAVNSSPMTLDMGLLHEEDLFAYLEGLRQSIQNLFTVDACQFVRRGSVDAPLNTQNVNLNANCTIRWVSIDAK